MKQLLSLTLSSLLLAITLHTVAANPVDKPAKANAAAVKDSTHPKHAKAVKPVTARCEAITKKGTQCTRHSKEGSKYCKQHQNYKPKS
jgi:hypothetical protein